MASVNVEEVFDACDTSNSGFLSFDDFAAIAPEISSEMRSLLFHQLDTDGDGQISKQEFLAGFEKVLDQQPENNPGVEAFKRRTSLSIAGDAASSSVARNGSSPQAPGTYRSTLRLKIPSGSKADLPSVSPLPKLELPLPCQEDLFSYHQALQETGVPDDLLQKFHKLVSGIYKEVTLQKQQHEGLLQAYQKEREKNAKHIVEIEAELEQQVMLAEERARRAERERLEKEKEEMRKQMAGEIAELQANIKKLQKMEAVLAESQQHSERLNEVKAKVFSLSTENRSLRSSLTDTETNMAIIKTELAKLQQEYSGKCTDLENEKEALVACIHEQDNLTRQIQLLNDANRDLRDTNDNLRSALEARQTFCRRMNLRTPSPISLSSHRSSVSPWSRQESNSSIGSNQSASAPLASFGQKQQDRSPSEDIPTARFSNSSPRNALSVPPVNPGRNYCTASDSKVGRNGVAHNFPELDDDDSGLVVRGSCDSEPIVPTSSNSFRLNGADPHGHDGALNNNRTNGNLDANWRRIPVESCSDSDRDSDDDSLHAVNPGLKRIASAPSTPLASKKLPPQAMFSNKLPFSASNASFAGSRPGQRRRAPFARSKTLVRQEAVSQGSDVPSPEQSAPMASKSAKTADPGLINRNGFLSFNKQPSNGEPDRTFRVVMTGDACVGKSSFVMRLCKGTFITNTLTTIGIDYHVKQLNVNGLKVAMQIWDTAGQERFRSMSQAYFRRADGIIMLYDCTCDQSFLNVRNWMHTVQEMALPNTPILICGNKIDAREEALIEGGRFVSPEEGQRLASVYRTLFAETSAKTGVNVMEAVIDLTKELLASEDYQLRSTALTLKQNEAPAKTSSCGRSSCYKL